MRVTARQLINIIRPRLIDADPWYGIYGNMPVIHNPKDDAYLLMSLNKAKQILQDSRIDKLRYLKNAFDCDKFALCVKAEFVLVRAFELWNSSEVEEQDLCSYAIGYADCLPATWHRLNLLVTDRSLYLVSGQTDKIWRPRAKDNIREIWL